MINFQDICDVGRAFKLAVQSCYGEFCDQPRPVDGSDKRFAVGVHQDAVLTKS